MKDRSSPGFLLIELMCACVLISGVACIFAYYQWHIVQWYYEARMQTEIITHVSEMIETNIREHRIPNNSTDYAITVHQKKAPQPTGGTLRDIIKNQQLSFNIVEVTGVWHSLSGNEKTVTFVTSSRSS